MSNDGQLDKKVKTQLLKDSPEASGKAKGERLRRIRHLANLSREDFCKDGDINITTLISWEIGRFGGLSAKGANRAIARVAKEGVFCTPEWLLYEVGAGPEVRVDYKKSNQPSSETITETDVDEAKIILQELMLFRKLNKHAVDYIIDDDTMFPHYQIGDYVAGTMRYGEEIKKLLGLDCLIHTKEGRFLVRNLQNGPRDISFNLVSTNLAAKSKDTVVYDIEVASAAPIVWHRRKQPV